MEMACWTCSPPNTTTTTHGLGQQLLPDVRQEGQREEAGTCCHLNCRQGCPRAEHQGWTPLLLRCPLLLVGGHCLTPAVTRPPCLFALVLLLSLSLSLGCPWSM